MQFSVIGAQNKDYMCTMQELADGLIESKTIGGGGHWSQCWFIENILVIILVQYIHSYIYHNYISILQVYKIVKAQ